MPKIKNKELSAVSHRRPSGVRVKPKCWRAHSDQRMGDNRLLKAVFQVFVCLVVLMVPADVWAGLTSLSLDANGDTIFRGGQERLNIVFTVDENTAEDGDSYTVTANQHLISRGTVQAEGSIRIGWDGRVNKRQLPDGAYTISVVLHKQGAPGEVLERSANAILDTKPPRISSVFVNQDANLLLTDGGFINVPVRTITVVPDPGEGSPIDFDAKQTNIVVKNARGVARSGSLSYTTELNFALGNPIDIRSENGRYILTITIVDEAGNAVESTIEFTFDNVAPNLTEVAGSRGVISSSAGVSQRLDFVEATLTDNFENGVNLSDSTIRLTGPTGEILGRQVFPRRDKVRWTFLSPLLPKDGLYDGEYTVEVVGTDKAGNQSGAIRVPFVYDNLAPKLVSLSPTQGASFNQIGDTIYHNQTLTQIIAAFDDGGGIGVDFEKNTRIQFSAIRDGNTSDVIPGRTFIDKTASQITYVLDEPLVSQDGRYRLEVQFADTLGNIDSETVLFLYDTQLPTLVSTIPAANETVSDLSQIQVVLNETASGIDFIRSSFRLTRDVGGSQIEVPVNIRNNGRDTATLTVLEPIALDGSDDGTYRIEVMPTDRAGNVGATARREFFLVSQSLTEVRLTLPESTIVSSLGTVVTELADYIGPGINFGESTLTVTNSQGVIVPERKLETDAASNLLTWSTDVVVPRNGTADGEYTINATFVDFTGKRFTQTFPILLDTQFPIIEGVRVTTGPQPLLSTSRTTDIAVSFSQIVVTFGKPAASALRSLQGSDSDVDFANTGVTLIGPAGANIPINRLDDGQTTLTLNFGDLTQTGEYVLSITPQDLTGNQSTAPFVYRFRIELALPTVSSVLIGEKTDGIVYVNNSETQIVATFSDPAGIGLDLGDDGSTITVTTEAGLPAPGITTSNGRNQLTWVPIVLPDDGSADGRYTIAVTPKDRTGRQGEVIYRQLIYDTQEPRITAATPLELNQPVTYVGGVITQLQFSIEDVGPAGLDLEVQEVELSDATGVPVAGTMTVDEISNQLYFTFDAPFPRDGTADGIYEVKFSLVDKSGNRLDAERKLVYDSQVPRLSSVMIDTDVPLALLPQRLTEILEPIDKVTLAFEESTRVDFANMVLTLTGPDGVSIPLRLEDNGKSELVANFLEVYQVGIYTLSVTPRDIAGNVSPGAINYRFALGLKLPSVSSVVISEQTGDVAYVNANNLVIHATFLDPNDTGLALDSEGSSILVRDASGVVVPGQLRVRGVDGLTWEPVSFPDDGSVDGRYTVDITPVDKIGRRGDVVSRQFIYDTEGPRIAAASPLMLNEPVSYIGDDFRQFVFTIEDVGPGGLFFEEQRIELLDATGAVVPTTLIHDELASQLYLTLVSPFSQDGATDGDYTVKVSLIDKAGNRLDTEHKLVYDSQVPRLSSVMIDTDVPLALLPQRLTEILEPIDKVTLAFEESTRVDFANMVVTLTGPDGVSIPLRLEDDGKSELVANFLEVYQVGIYTLSVTPRDIAGNVSPGAINYRFALGLKLPSVSSVVISEQTGDVAYVNANTLVIHATFLDPNDTGLALDSEGSSILVRDASGVVVPGQLRVRGVDGLTWEPVSFPDDGSVDGRYTVDIMPVDKIGRRGDVVSRQFIYDTEGPRIAAASPLMLNEPVSYIGDDFRQFVFTIEDVGPGGLFFEEQRIELLDATGAVVPTTLIHDELASQLYLTLVSPFSQDGATDGDYTVKVSLVDKAGNRLDTEHKLVYDSQVPRLSSVMIDTDVPLALLPQRLTEILEPIDKVTLAFEESTRVDFANMVVTLTGPDGVSIPLRLEDNGKSELVANFLEVYQVGIYTLSVTPRDIAGNVSPGAINYRFALGLKLPSVSSVVISEQTGDVAYVNANTLVIHATFLDPNDTGLALDSEGSSILVRDASGVVVPGQLRVRGVDGLTWEPVSFPDDGSVDGRYTVDIMPVDKIGRRGDVVSRQFIYDTEGPRIAAASPLMLNEPVSYIGDDFRQFVFTIEDVGPGGLFFEEQRIELLDATGAVVPTTLIHDELASQLYLTLVSPFSQDGATDGDYTVKVSLVDKSGNRLDTEHKLVYDSQVPRLSSVMIDTDVPLALLPQRLTEILEPIDKVTLAFEESTRVDFANMVVTLTGPDGVSIPLRLEDNGKSELVANFLEVYQVGIYTLSVTPRDIAGNVSPGAINYRFALGLKLPSVSSVVISEQTGDVAYVNANNLVIHATFLDPNDTGLALDSEGSSILVRDASGVVVPGQLRVRGVDGLTWEPVSFPDDGSVDGRYTVDITPVDKIGRRGDVVSRQFIYDTEGPRIAAASPLLLNEPVSYIGDDFRQFVFTIEDVGPAGLDLEVQEVELSDATGVSVAGTMTVDEISNQLYFTFDAPFPRDGTADGIYEVKFSLVDKSGNRLDTEHKLVYDSQVPRLSSVMIDTDVPLVLLPQRLTEILEPIDKVTLAFEESTRVDFANMVLTLTGPDGVSIPLRLEDNGKSELVANFLEVYQVGIYTLSVTPRDIAGNVSPGAINYRFALGLKLPSVSSVVISEQTGDVAYVNANNLVIDATFLDPNDTGLALDSEGSSILVRDASGVVVPGQLRVRGVDGLTWEPVSFPDDGSVDGRYTVDITPVDKIGRRGDVVSRQFIYDTEGPRIAAASPLLLNEPVSYIGDDFRQFVFTIEDVGPGGLFFEEQRIELLDATGAVVPTTLIHDELASQLYLTLVSPFSQDGATDGDYTVKVSLVDKAGNRLDSEHVFIYDSRAPRLTSVMVDTDPRVELLPSRITDILESISSLTLQFEEATRIDFSNIEITLTGPESTNASGEVTAPSIPLTLEDNGASQITASFLELEQIGSYTLSVTLQDIVGNAPAGASDYRFLLDIALPRVDRVIIGEQANDVAYVNASNMVIVAVLLDPTETGLAFGSQGSTITVTTPDGTVVPGTTSTNNVDLIGWEPVTFTSDGSTDGRYNVYVTPVDKAGRQGNIFYREFVYDTQEPEVTAAAPVDLSQPVSYISHNLTQFRFAVTDIGPADLELSDQQISLRDAGRNLISTQLTNDNNSELFLTLDEPLSRDGSMDGEYTVRVALADKAGNAFRVDHLIVYDTQAPTLVSTVPADGALVTADRTQVQVTLNDEGGSGIDWDITTVTLINPSGSEISGELVSDGTTRLTLNTNQLIEDGRYIIRVQAVDRAGNGSATIFERSFLLSRRLPAIVATLPKTAPADEAFTNEELEQIELTLETDDENHLSTLRLLNASNQVVAGQQLRESDRLVYNLVRPLAVDGSDDGVYTIEFTPISASGRSGDVQLLTFTHDTEVPEIEPEAISLVVASPEVNNSLTEIRVNPTDEQSGIDWKNVDEAWVVFERLSPNPTKIAGRVEDDNDSVLSFILTVPLADNGSADGEYRVTITPKDKAGNGDVSYEKVFTYDTSPPMIDASTLLLNDAPLLVDINAVDYPTAVSTTGGVVIQANMFDTGLGVNLAQSRIVVRGPGGAEVSGSTQQNGVDTVVFKSDGLRTQGLYQVTVISVGNDSELLGFAPMDSVTTQFLYETTVPIAAVTADGGETELTDKALPLEGTASDPSGTQQGAEGEIQIPASGVWLVEIVGTGPDKQPIDPVPCVDDSNAEQEPWSIWSVDFLPTRSGEYDLDVRVTDNAGNYEVYDIGKYTMSVSLTFREPTFGWPNPLRISRGDVAFFSFDVNVPLGETVELTLSIYDWSGDMVLLQTYPDVVSGQRNDQLVKWNLKNQAGNSVARGLYIFRLEAVNAAGNSANVVGKVLVVE